MATAVMKLEILEDGMIRIVTDEAIPQEHHANADELLTFLHEKAGGNRATEKLREGHIHTHSHSHSHNHVHT